MATDNLIAWFEREATMSLDRIQSIEVKGMRWRQGVGDQAMTDVTADLLAEAKERLAYAEEQLAKLRGRKGEATESWISGASVIADIGIP